MPTLQNARGNVVSNATRVRETFVISSSRHSVLGFAAAVGAVTSLA